MFHNFHIKIAAFLLALTFWFFIVSYENRFVEFAPALPTQVFNLASDVALSTKLDAVHVGIQVQDPVTMRKLTPEDFEAYIDLRDVGVGKRTVPVSVTSKNPQVTVVRVQPREVEVELEPVREKNLKLTTKVSGAPKVGYKVQLPLVITPETITVSGADSVLKSVVRAEIVIKLNGQEESSYTVADPKVSFLDVSGAALDGITFTDKVSLKVQVPIVEVELSRQIGVQAKVGGAVADGVVTKIEVNPGVVGVIGAREVIEKLSTLETEEVKLDGASESFEKVVGIVLPLGVTLAPGQSPKVTVKVQIEKK